MSTIACSVGILTYNSETTLCRALESVKDFSNIIISDGGSTDATLDIARKYGCMILDQEAKFHPGSAEDHPISDFSVERNKLVTYATEDWFLWIDSDEYISDELHNEIAVISAYEVPKLHAYKIPIAIQSADTQVTYRTLKQIYQIRFFNLKTGGKFHRKIHEKFKFDTDIYSTGTLAGLWYVPISKPTFTTYKKAVDYRLRIMLCDAVPITFTAYMTKALYRPLKRSMGTIYQYIRLRTKYPAKEIIPLGYIRNRLYSQWVTFKIVTQLYFRGR